VSAGEGAPGKPSIGNTKATMRATSASVHAVSTDAWQAGRGVVVLAAA